MADVAHLVKSNAPAQEVRTINVNVCEFVNLKLMVILTIIFLFVNLDRSLESSAVDSTSAPGHCRSHQLGELLPGGSSHYSAPSDCRHRLQPRATVSRLPRPTTSPGGESDPSRASLHLMAEPTSLRFQWTCQFRHDISPEANVKTTTLLYLPSTHATVRVQFRVGIQWSFGKGCGFSGSLSER